VPTRAGTGLRRPELALAVAGGLVASFASHEWTAVHPVIGLAFASVAALHLSLHRRWFRAAARRFGRGLARRAALRVVVAGALAASLLVVAASGFGLWLGACPVLWHVHVIGIVVLALAVAAHLTLHRGSLGRRARRA